VSDSNTDGAAAWARRRGHARRSGCAAGRSRDTQVRDLVRAGTLRCARV